MNSSTKARATWLMIVGFLVSTLLLLTLFNSAKPRILVVHSLSKESSWASAVDVGISRVLSTHRLPATVTREYLNLDILSEEADLERMVKEVRRKIKAMDPHVLVAVDDETNHLLGRHYVDQNRMQLVYTGLMHEPGRYGYSEDRGVFGIREPVPLAPITALLDEIGRGEPLRIAVVGIDDLTGTAEMKQVLAHDWGRHRLVSHAVVPHFEAWQQYVQGPATQADVLLVLTIDKVPASAVGMVMARESDVTLWTETHSAPLPIGVRHSFVQMGGGLAASVPPDELGGLAIQMAFEHLAKPHAQQALKSVTATAFDISIRQSILRKRQVQLSEIYVQAARAAGHLYP